MSPELKTELPSMSQNKSGMANGLRQLVALAAATRADAVALTPWDWMPSSGPKKVGSVHEGPGITSPLCPLRYTFTRTQLPEKPGGHSKRTSTAEEAPDCDGQTGSAADGSFVQLDEPPAHSAA